MSDVKNKGVSTIDQIVSQPYKYGFATEIEKERIPVGLDENTVRLLSSKKGEPEFMRQSRLQALKIWKNLDEPNCAELQHPEINYQDITYYSAPKKKKKLDNLSEVDPELLKTFDKLGISLNEQKRLSNVAVDAVFDSVSIATTFKKELAKAGVIF